MSDKMKGMDFLDNCKDNEDHILNPDISGFKLSENITDFKNCENEIEVLIKKLNFLEKAIHEGNHFHKGIIKKIAKRID